MALCATDKKKVVDRLNRIEGQIRGIRKMVEDERPCMDILKQIAAVRGAIRGVGMVVLEDHLKGCVSEAMRGDGNHDDLMDQVIEIFNKFSK